MAVIDSSYRQAASQPKSINRAFVLWFLLGGVGAHHLYLRRYGQASLHVCLVAAAVLADTAGAPEYLSPVVTGALMILLLADAVQMGRRVDRFNRSIAPIRNPVQYAPTGTDATCTACGLKGVRGRYCSDCGNELAPAVTDEPTVAQMAVFGPLLCTVGGILILVGSFLPWGKVISGLFSVAQMPASADVWLTGACGAFAIAGAVLAVVLGRSRLATALLLSSLAVAGSQIGAVGVGFYRTNHDAIAAHVSPEIGFVLLTIGTLVLMSGVGLLTLSRSRDADFFVGLFPAVVLIFGVAIGVGAALSDGPESPSSQVASNEAVVGSVQTTEASITTTTQAPLQAGMTPTQYAQLVIGSTTASEALPILQDGGHCHVSAQSQLYGSSSEVVSCDGQGEPGANVQLQFVNNTLSSKSQYGLQRNPYASDDDSETSPCGVNGNESCESRD